MGKTYETPELVVMTLEMGVYGSYGNGGDDDCGGGHGHGHGHGGSHGGGWWH